MTTSLVQLYCDGACLGNPGPGGWAALLVTKQNGKLHEKLIFGAQQSTTNNQMELQAAIEGLKLLKRACRVEVYSDSQYVVKGMTSWIANWRLNGFKNSQKKPIANQTQWVELYEVSQAHNVSWHWVKGHSGHPENERVDGAARAAAESIVRKLS